METLKTMPRFWTDNGFYIEMLWLLSIGIMLDYEDNLIQSLVQLIKDREAKDYIYDTLIRYRFLDWERTTNKVLYPSPYQAAITVTELAEQDKAEAMKRLEKYLKKNGIEDILIYLGMTTINMVSTMTVIGVLKAVHWSRSWG